MLTHLMCEWVGLDGHCRWWMRSWSWSALLCKLKDDPKCCQLEIWSRRYPLTSSLDTLFNFFCMMMKKASLSEHALLLWEGCAFQNGEFFFFKFLRTHGKLFVSLSLTFYLKSEPPHQIYTNHRWFLTLMNTTCRLYNTNVIVRVRVNVQKAKGVAAAKDLSNISIGIVGRQ